MAALLWPASRARPESSCRLGTVSPHQPIRAGHVMTRPMRELQRESRCAMAALRTRFRSRRVSVYSQPVRYGFHHQVQLLTNTRCDTNSLVTPEITQFTEGRVGPPPDWEVRQGAQGIRRRGWCCLSCDGELSHTGGLSQAGAILDWLWKGWLERSSLNWESRL